MSAQKEQLKAIATRLSQERQKKSMSLEEIAAKTYIPQRLLIALEDANLDRLPEPVFIQGFIRRFADAIGLDGIALSKEFTVDLSPLPAPATASLISNTIEPQTPKPTALKSSIPKAPEPALPKASEPAVPKAPEPSIPRAAEPPQVVHSEAPTPLPTPKASEPAAIRDPQPAQKLEPTAVRDSVPTPPRISTSEPPARLPLIALAAAIGLGVIGVLASTFVNRQPERSNPSAATSPTVQPSQAPTPGSSAPVASTPPSSPTPASPSPGAVNVKMNITEESWVEVLVDGTSVYEGTLTKGTQRSWSGKSVEINTGNAGGVSLSYNNGEAKVMGAAGDLGSATFPPTP